MKKIKNKAVGLAAGATLLFGGVALGTNVLNWGGEDNIQKIEVIIDSLKNEVVGRDKLIEESKQAGETLSKEISILNDKLAEAEKTKVELEKQISFLSNEVLKGDVKLQETNEYYTGVISETDKFYGDEISRMANEILKLQSDKGKLELDIFNINGEKAAAEAKYNEALNNLSESDQKLEKAKLDVENLLNKAEQTLKEVQVDGEES